MKIMAVIDGEKVCVQIVKRKDTVYIRRCAYTMFEPTERQNEVRRTLALSAIASYDEAEALNEHITREDINYAIRLAFEKWKREPKRRNEIEEILDEEYGDVEDVKRSYKNLKAYEYR